MRANTYLGLFIILLTYICSPEVPQNALIMVKIGKKIRIMIHYYSYALFIFLITKWNYLQNFMIVSPRGWWRQELDLVTCSLIMHKLYSYSSVQSRALLGVHLYNIPSQVQRMQLYDYFSMWHEFTQVKRKFGSTPAPCPL